MTQRNPDSLHELKMRMCSRRSFLGKVALVAAAGAAGAGRGAAQATEPVGRRVGADSPCGGPISKVTTDGKIIKLDPKPLVTSMYTVSQIQLGPAEVMSEVPRPDGLCPLIALVAVQPDTQFRPLIHDGLSLAVYLPTLQFKRSERYAQPVRVRFDGVRPTREFSKGGMSPAEGVREFAMYPNAYAAMPLFKDRDDPVVTALYRSLPDGGAAFRARPNPPAWKSVPPPTPNPLDRQKHARKARGATLYPCQVGPGAWGAIFDYYDPSPYVMLVDLEPGASIPASRHNGWSGVGVIDGTVDVAGVTSTEGSFVLFEPLARHRFKSGPKGASMMIYYDSGRAAFPMWDDPSDRTAMEIDRVLQVPS